jgi:tRNA dimethylallyltransferase
MQIYRCMDIGTAKPTPAEQAAAPHHMIDIVDPDQAFDAAAITRKWPPMPSDRIIDAAVAPAMVVGGTGFYIKALLHGLFEAGLHQTRRFAARLKQQCSIPGSPGALHRRLEKIDSTAAGKNSSQRHLSHPAGTGNFRGHR